MQENNDIIKGKRVFKVVKTKARLYENPSDAMSKQYSNHGTELLFGELFEEKKKLADGWIEGRSLTDGYEGVMNMSALRLVHKATEKPYKEYIITKPMAPLYVEPYLKSKIKYHIPFMGSVTLSDHPDTNKDDYIYLEEEGGWLNKYHIRAKDEGPHYHSTEQLCDELAKTAQLFLNSPYIYGGKTFFGLDCSALIQLAFKALGLDIPRDSGPQLNYLSDVDLNHSVHVSALKLNEAKFYKTGDIVFFPGHVGMMVDGQHIINASSRFMSVQIEPLAILESYYKETQGAGVTGICRPIVKA